MVQLMVQPLLLNINDFPDDVIYNIAIYAGNFFKTALSIHLIFGNNLSLPMSLNLTCKTL